MSDGVPIEPGEYTKMTKGDVDRYMTKNFDRLANEWWQKKMIAENTEAFKSEADIWAEWSSKRQLFKSEQQRIERLWELYPHDNNGKLIKKDKFTHDGRTYKWEYSEEHGRKIWVEVIGPD